jgi:protein-S-isoprenylcysteine O-methyltransferase Ste14
MYDENTMRLLAAIVLAGTVLGVGLLFRGISRGPRRQGRVVAERPQKRATELVWSLGTMVVQGWAAGVETVQTVGFAVWAAGMILVNSAGWALGRFTTSAIEARDDHRLIQEGPYRWIRHPMYTANVALGTGLTLLFLSPFLAVLTAILAATALYRALLEEDLLRSPAVFGATYDRYIAHTGRFLPRVRGVRVASLG